MPVHNYPPCPGCGEKLIRKPAGRCPHCGAEVAQFVADERDRTFRALGGPSPVGARSDNLALCE